VLCEQKEEMEGWMRIYMALDEHCGSEFLATSIHDDEPLFMELGFLTRVVHFPMLPVILLENASMWRTCD
jgi:hypothetical protein